MASWHTQPPEELQLNALATKREAANFASRTIDQVLKMLDERVVVLAEQTIVDALKNCNWDVNKSFIRRGIRNVSHNHSP